MLPRDALFALFESLLALGPPLARTLEAALPRIAGGDWWETCVLARLGEDDLRIIREGGKTRLDELDISVLLKTLVRNWDELSALDRRRFTEKQKDLARRVRDIRNFTMHLTVNGIAGADFDADFDVLRRFAAFLGVDTAEAAEKLYTAQAGEAEAEAVRKSKLCALLNDRIIEPALRSALLDADIKESIDDTRRRLKAKTSSKELYDFFYDALDARRGRQIYGALKEAGLCSFEDVIDEFFALYWEK